MAKSKEQKAAEKARKRELRALAAAATTLWIMGGGKDELVGIAVQAATIAAAGELNSTESLALAETFENLAAQLREMAERGDPESNT